MAAVAPIAAPLMLASSAISAYGQMRAGPAQRRMYEQQAAQAKLRGRAEAIAYKQKGADALRNLNEVLSTIISRAAVGVGDPTSGSAATIQKASMGEGVREFNIAADNAAMALGQASEQAGIYKQAGQTAQLNSYVQAAGTFGQAVYKYGQL